MLMTKKKKKKTRQFPTLASKRSFCYAMTFTHNQTIENQKCLCWHGHRNKGKRHLAYSMWLTTFISCYYPNIFVFIMKTLAPTGCCSKCKNDQEDQQFSRCKSILCIFFITYFIIRVLGSLLLQVVK